MVDIMLETAYSMEFCIAVDFDLEFIVRLMEAGCLVMSAAVQDPSGEPFFILLPKLHLVRSALFFDNLHIKKSIRRHLELYELRPDADFEFILDRCVAIHGDDWLTEPLVNAIKRIRFLSAQSGEKDAPFEQALPDVFSRVRPASFALYRDGKLVAGEFGVIAGRVYTSYSGYYDEDNSGTVQLIKTTRYLRDKGFTFFDLGMPLNYKTGLGALDIGPEEFVKLFRQK
jgi:Leu/Phe-tRNA-protein transferase